MFCQIPKKLGHVAKAAPAVLAATPYVGPLGLATTLRQVAELGRPQCMGIA
jgi:hypothetical protein